MLPVPPIWYCIPLPATTVLEYKYGGNTGMKQYEVLWKWTLDWFVLTSLSLPIICHLYVLPIPCPPSMNAINSPPPTTTTTTAAAPGLPVYHSELATAIPTGLLLLLVFVKHNQWLAQLTRPLTTAPVRHECFLSELYLMQMENRQTWGEYIRVC